MVHEIHIPQLGMDMKEATIVEWRVSDGAEVEKESVLVEIETDKAVHEITAPSGGFLKILQPKGMIVPVGGIIAVIGATPEECKTAALHAQSSGAAVGTAEPSSPPPSSAPSPGLPKGKFRISGIARRIAEKHGVDIPQIRPSDPGGQISKEDVERFIQERSTAQSKPPVGGVVIPGVTVRERIPLGAKKRAMAQRLTESLQVMAQMTNWEDVDMSRVLEIKNSGVLEKTGSPYRLTLNDFFVKLTAQALKEYPLVNSSLVGDELYVWEDINIAIAVAVGDDLVTPVIRNVDRKPIQQVSQELGGMIVRARENRLSIYDISGSTISITNIGALGANPGTPIIQIPHAAIVGFGAVVKKPVVVNDQIVIRPMLFMAVTVDHRFITGAVSAEFRKRLKSLIETADPEVLEGLS
jgi:pyruvate/2-oxoglutarate dehydrogenase complex dihydrolipoamide acyltransferase (E2) component